MSRWASSCRTRVSSWPERLVVDRQNAEVIAGQPEQEIPAAQGAPCQLPALAAPAGAAFEGVEFRLAQPDVRGVGPGPGGDLLPAIVRQDFAQLVG